MPHDKRENTMRSSTAQEIDIWFMQSQMHMSMMCVFWIALTDIAQEAAHPINARFAAWRLNDD